MKNKNLMSRYATQTVNPNFYSTISLSGSSAPPSENISKDGGPGYVMAPFTIKTSTKGPSKAYKKFMKAYRAQHELCPKCGSKNHESTLMGFVLNMDMKDEYKDLNRCKCMNCGDTHTAHERISRKEFEELKS